MYLSNATLLSLLPILAAPSLAYDSSGFGDNTLAARDAYEAGFQDGYDIFTRDVDADELGFSGLNARDYDDDLYARDHDYELYTRDYDEDYDGFASLIARGRLQKTQPRKKTKSSAQTSHKPHKAPKTNASPSYQRYKANQKAMGKTTGNDRKNHGVEAYIGRIEEKYSRLGKGERVDKGHQQAISDLGNSFRKAEGLPKYNQADPVKTGVSNGDWTPGP